MVPFLWRRWVRGSVRRVRRSDSKAGRWNELEMLEVRAVPTSVVFHPYIRATPFSSPSPAGNGYTSTQIRHAYGLGQVAFAGGVAADGTGMTIAIVDAFDDPTVVADLQTFDKAFNLPAPPSFRVVNQTGGSTLPASDQGWAGEISIDVQWAHAIAPGANLILVEADDAAVTNILAAAKFAGSVPGVEVVSMSLGFSETSDEATAVDPIFTTPTGHVNETFVAASGDQGAPPSEPAISPNVLAVGGTTLNLDAAGNIQSESGWTGSGGGLSNFETQPAYQKGVVTQSTTVRTNPDVSYDADPNTGFPVVDSFVNGASNPWEQDGGTSIACPQWAAMLAIVDQGRVLYGRQPLDGPSETLPMIYALPTTNFHDITSGGSTGSPPYNAGAGYDLVTGIGTPISNQIIPILVGPPPGGGGGGGGPPTAGPFYFTPDPAEEAIPTTLFGFFSDQAGMFTTHSVDITWGDGTADSVFDLNPTIQQFNFSHTYTVTGAYIAKVDIKAIGGAGAADLSGTAPVTVNDQPPEVTIVDVPTSPVPEGKPIDLVASVNNATLNDTFTYLWSATKNGAPYSVSNNTSQSFNLIPDDQGVYRATVRVTNTDGAVASNTTPNITAFNVAPTATLVNNSPKAAGTPVTFNFLNQSDAAADMIAGFTYSYDFDGNGTFDLVTTSSVAAFTYTTAGVYTAKGRITDKDGGFTDYTTHVAIGLGGDGGIVSTRYVVTGADAGGGPAVKAFNLDGTLKYSFFAYDKGFTGGVRVATGDVNGDGVDDIITAAGAGGGPHIEVFDGKTGNLINSFFAYDPSFTGGVYLATGDVNGDGFADIITAAGAGGGPHVEVWSGKDGSLLQSFFAYDPNFTGGVSVATGDVNGDGYPDIVTGAGPGGGPHVEAFDGRTNALLASFFAATPSFTGGIYVAAGDLKGTGHADIITGLGADPNTESRVRVFDGLSLALMYDFAPYSSFRGGVRVAVEDIDNDGKADLVIAPGRGLSGNVLGLKGTNLSQLLNFSPYDPSFLGGVFVG